MLKKEFFMQEKIYNCGVVVGRFSPIHIGHEHLINIALGKCKRVVLIVTSKGNIDEKNPYDLEFRISLIKKIYRDQVNNGNLIITTFTENQKLDTSYGDSILRIVKEVANIDTDYIIYGSDKDISKCFSKEAISNIHYDIIDRNDIPVSATAIRKALKENNNILLEKYLNSKIYNEIESLKFTNKEK